MAIDFNIVKHVRAELGKVLAQTGGAHLFSLDISGETGFFDNGQIVKVTGMKEDELDLYDYEAASSSQIEGKVILKSPTYDDLWLVEITDVTDDALALVYQLPLNFYEEPYDLANADFTNDPKDGPVRAYQLRRFDTFWLSGNGFGGDTPEVGKTFDTITDGKPVLE